MTCKICHGDTEIQGCVDAGRTCEVNKGVYLPLTGRAVWYHRCMDCGFIFTRDYDDWTYEDFLREIYNEQYGEVDPGWTDGARARLNADLTRQVMGMQQARSVLDYGCGKDAVCTKALLADGVKAFGFDALFTEVKPRYSVDLVTAFEVFEHTPTPVETVRDALSFGRLGAPLLFTTMLHDGYPRQATDSWYIAPRNGHVSVYTSESLRRLFGPLGYKVGHFSPNTHFAERV